MVGRGDRQPGYRLLPHACVTRRRHPEVCASRRIGSARDTRLGGSAAPPHHASCASAGPSPGARPVSASRLRSSCWCWPATSSTCSGGRASCSGAFPGRSAWRTCWGTHGSWGPWSSATSPGSWPLARQWVTGATGGGFAVAASGLFLRIVVELPSSIAQVSLAEMQPPRALRHGPATRTGPGSDRRRLRPGLRPRRLRRRTPATTLGTAVGAPVLSATLRRT